VYTRLKENDGAEDGCPFGARPLIDLRETLRSVEVGGAHPLIDLRKTWRSVEVSGPFCMLAAIPCRCALGGKLGDEIFGGKLGEELFGGKLGDELFGGIPTAILVCRWNGRIL
jgi:hypothetical protein